jgi:acetoin utilization deacetylase AcuC-like enzyme
MNVLFNHKFLLHNIASQGEGAYRIRDFEGIYENEEVNGENFLTLVHPEQYTNWIKEACSYGDTVAEMKLSPESFEAACLAVGLTIRASEQNDFAVVRPPGHHAGVERAAGFCFFNNIAIAAQKLVNEGKKVFIFDFDGHHGDGTQSIFYRSNKVFFCSVHQYQAFPYSGFPHETGEDEGKGYTLNLPLIPGSGDKEFLNALDKAIKKAKEFQPDVIGVSAGFDGYYKDRVLDLQYTLDAFYECGFRLRRTFRNIFAVLEGGYHTEIKECVLKFIQGVNQGAKPSRIKWDSDMSIG